MRNGMSLVVAVSTFVIGLGFISTACAQENPQPKSLPPNLLSEPHPFGVHDMVRMERVGTPLPSPNGKWIVFSVRAWDAEANKASTNLWLVSTDGGAPRQLTSAKYKSDNSPAWSPDSHTVAFISNRSGSSQIWTIATDGGEASQLTTFPVDAENFRWSPTGSFLAFSAEVYPDADMKTTAERDKAKADNPVKATKFNRLFIRHWDAWEDGKRSHIFVLPVKEDKSKGWQTAGEPRDLMKGIDADCPTKP
ncbi:MAG TPA: hypothetical protein VGI40_14890, partial [Pirellulaceae bacterium]